MAPSSDESGANDIKMLIDELDPSPSEVHLSCLGGIDDEPPSPGFRLFRRALIWTVVGVPIGLFAIVLFVPFRVNHGSNENWAIQSLHDIAQAQLQYKAKFPSIGYACSLKDFGSDPKSGPPSPAAAQILRGDLSSGVRWGYSYAISSCAKDKIQGRDVITGYQATAVPQVPGKTGKRGFCVDQSCTIKFDPAGGTNCAQTVF